VPEDLSFDEVAAEAQRYYAADPERLGTMTAEEVAYIANQAHGLDPDEVE
jgi:hypothetical protein